MPIQIPYGPGPAEAFAGNYLVGLASRAGQQSQFATPQLPSLQDLIAAQQPQAPPMQQAPGWVPDAQDAAHQILAQQGQQQRFGEQVFGQMMHGSQQLDLQALHGDQQLGLAQYNQGAITGREQNRMQTEMQRQRNQELWRQMQADWEKIDQFSRYADPHEVQNARDAFSQKYQNSGMPMPVQLPEAPLPDYMNPQKIYDQMRAANPNVAIGFDPKTQMPEYARNSNPETSPAYLQQKESHENQKIDREGAWRVQAAKAAADARAQSQESAAAEKEKLAVGTHAVKSEAAQHSEYISGMPKRTNYTRTTKDATGNTTKTEDTASYQAAVEDYKQEWADNHGGRLPFDPPAQGGQGASSSAQFASPDDLKAAFKSGAVKVGDTVNGPSGPLPITPAVAAMLGDGSGDEQVMGADEVDHSQDTPLKGSEGWPDPWRKGWVEDGVGENGEVLPAQMQLITPPVDGV